MEFFLFSMGSAYFFSICSTSTKYKFVLFS